MLPAVRTAVVVGGTTYAPEILAVCARCTVPPSSARRRRMNRLGKALIRNGTWAKRDALYLMDAADAQAAQRNWIQDLFNLAEVGTTTHTRDRGYAGNGTDGYLNTGFNPATASSPKFVQDSAHMGLTDRSVRAGSATFVEMGARNGAASTSVIGTRSSTDTFNFRANNVDGGAVSTVTNALSSGRFLVSRTGSAALEAFRNGVSLATSTKASLPPANFDIYIGCRNDTGTAGTFSTDQLSQASIGSGLTPAEAAADDAAFQQYFAPGLATG